MSGYKAQQYRVAKEGQKSATDYLAIIGKTTKHTTVASRHGEAETAGAMTTFSIKTKIHFQEYDGGQNYHECREFDAAIKRAALECWEVLRDRAMQIISEDVAKAAIAAKSELRAELEQIDVDETNGGAA